MQQMTRTELRAWLTKRNMTVRELSKRLDVTETTVSRWLGGFRRVPRWLSVVLAHIDRQR